MCFSSSLTTFSERRRVGDLLRRTLPFEIVRDLGNNMTAGRVRPSVRRPGAQLRFPFSQRRAAQIKRRLSVVRVASMLSFVPPSVRVVFAT